MPGVFGLKTGVRDVGHPKIEATVRWLDSPNGPDFPISDIETLVDEGLVKMRTVRSFALGWLGSMLLWASVGDPIRAQEVSKNLRSSEGADPIGELAAPVRLFAAAEPIDVEGCAAPAFADVDRDGRPDLIVGQMDLGRARLYRNIGTRKQPVFGASTPLSAGDHLATVPTGCAVGFSPCWTDYNGDGVNDILTASFPCGVVFAFVGQPDGSFSKPVVLSDESGVVQLAPRVANGRLAVADWDGDGDQDLLVGDRRVFLVRNVGTTTRPRYAAAERLSVAGDEAWLGGRVFPILADWDDDGRNDLITGDDRGIVWYRDASRSGEPSFEPPRLLIARAGFAPAAPAAFDRKRDLPTQRFYAICACDFDADGRLDLLLGDHVFRPRALSAEETAAYSQASKIRKHYWNGYQELVSRSGTFSERDRRIAFQDALTDWRELTGELYGGPQGSSHTLERSGGVWLFRRLAE